MPNICQEDICELTASYNYPSEKRGAYCTKHKKDGMVDKVNIRCNFEGCGKVPAYNFKGEKKGIYCAIHKKDNMVDLKNKICLEDSCGTLATWNKEGERLGLYCKVHKKDGMVNIKKKRMCIESGCKATASYNYEDAKYPEYCGKHRKDTMFVFGSSRCKYKGCNIHASFNYRDKKTAAYCITHKNADMVRVGHKSCQEEGCDKSPIYGEERKKALYCASHKKDGMINLKDTLCKTHLCHTIIKGDKYEGYCVRCFMYMFPDRPVTKNYKTKETSVTEYIMKEFSDKTIICDKKVVDGCSKRRPDMFLDLGEQVIIIEVDENQHTEYNCSCENKRIMELSGDVGHRPLVFIRFNPDEYVGKDGGNVTSCWGTNKKGICTIKKTRIKEWNKRLECLKTLVQYWIDNKTDKTVEIVQLFYDEDVSN